MERMRQGWADSRESRSSEVAGDGTRPCRWQLGRKRRKRGQAVCGTRTADGRPLRTTWPDESYTENTFDGQLLLSVRDRAGVVATFAYDDLGRRTAVTNGRNKTTTTTYLWGLGSGLLFAFICAAKCKSGNEGTGSLWHLHRRRPTLAHHLG